MGLKTGGHVVGKAHPGSSPAWVLSLGLCFLTAGGGLHAEWETTTYRGVVKLKSHRCVALDTKIHLVTDQGEFKKLVVSDAAEGFYFVVVRGVESDSALLHYGRESSVYDAMVDVDLPGIDQVLTVGLIEGPHSVGEVTIWFDEIVPPSPQPFGGGSPGVDIARRY